MLKLLRPLLLALVVATALVAPTSLLGSRALAQDAAAPAPVAIPVEKHDATNGSVTAPVTVVTFTDLQCPFCRKLSATLDALRVDYGKSDVRFVTKHYPLAFHQLARPAADAAAAVRSLHGEKAALAFIARAFESLAGQGSWEDAARAEQLDVARIQAELATGTPQKKVDLDMALAERLGVRGTPATFVNGVLVSGAQPKEKLAAAIDAELAAAAELEKNGAARADLSATRTKQNLEAAAKAAAAAPKPSPARVDADDETVWKVPVGKSPARGPKHAPVTLVVFSDFQCPYCQRLAPTLDALVKKYPSELRVVFKHNPLPFHDRAEPAAELALEAMAKKGEKGFWAAHDAIFARNRSGLDDDGLGKIAEELGLSRAATLAKLGKRVHQKAIEDDAALAETVDASGTPTSFINGKKLPGAQPIEKFVARIDAELAAAQKLRADGIAAAKLYEHIIKNGKEKTIAETVTVAAPTQKNPHKGPLGAKVTIQIFTDFECPFCGRVQDTLTELEKLYSGKVRFVFRNMPLPFHAHAHAAHTFAMEAFRQKGATGFWKAHDLLFANQSSLTRADLLAHAATLGLDAGEVDKALGEDRHKDVIEADTKAASDAGISGTPCFVIDGYLLEGAQPLSAFRRVVDHALKGKARTN